MTLLPRRFMLAALAGILTAGWLLAPAEKSSPVVPAATAVPAAKPASTPLRAPAKAPAKPSDVRRLGTVPSEQAWNTG